MLLIIIIPFHLFYILANETLVGPAVEVVSKKVVEAGPGQCPFETRHIFTTERLSEKRYSIYLLRSKCNYCFIILLNFLLAI